MWTRKPSSSRLASITVFYCRSLHRTKKSVPPEKLLYKFAADFKFPHSPKISFYISWNFIASSFASTPNPSFPHSIAANPSGPYRYSNRSSGTRLLLSTTSSSVKSLDNLCSYTVESTTTLAFVGHLARSTTSAFLRWTGFS